MHCALLIVDLQNDFIEGGSLAVPGSRNIIPIINKFITQYEYVLTSLDWHPANHVSFASQHPGHAVGDSIELSDGSSQILWPDHCIQGSTGAAISAELHTDSVDLSIQKGEDVSIDSYSAFFDANRKKKTKLDEELKKRAIDSVHICGLATDYCVYYTVLDALFLGYDCTLLRSACRAVNLQKGDEEKAVHEMSLKGARIID